MTSPSIEQLIAEGDPLTPPDWNDEKARALRAHNELVRQQCVAEYSKHPLWQERAAKTPDFWKTFSVGQFNRYDDEGKLIPFPGV